ncbi:hypothetical protein [Komagataeibacter europaeus]|uniref:hypothetical protein n=1 Tax=Komagataeibacter europaeus TaxID=33995 RepID=UPI0012FB8D43|nr:hypothetical protein [Komagataeibacter europaeus]GBQ46936.1 hypothetical protein AA18890_2686 [Komagataeibacter europaeus LMG 18890]
MGRIRLSAEEIKRRKLVGYEDRKLLQRIGWTERTAASRFRMSQPQLNRCLSGKGPPLKPEIRAWLRKINDFLKENPPPFADDILSALNGSSSLLPEVTKNDS